ncbi:hypothetical protein [Planktothrix pseudagardhii]|uniref:hypothetical protein n=1 Tax=Planktothrix pseudagardhii TaxID=132604 RepID=UPI0020B2C7F6|nr:hypothetical protein [Planktothrix pseudagardhii]
MNENDRDKESLSEFSDQVSVKLIEFINKDLRDFWCSIRTTFSQASDPVKNLAEKLPEIFAETEPDDNLREQRVIYLAIGQFIRDHLQKPLPICLNAVHIFLEEKNLSLLEDGAIGGDRLIEDVKKLIVMIRINYEQQDSWMYNRTIEIYFLKEGLRKVQKVPALIDWDKLPSKIREQRMRQQQINIITLYPKET